VGQALLDTLGHHALDVLAERVCRRRDGQSARLRALLEGGSAEDAPDQKALPIDSSSASRHSG
jgi:hypothetical protein